MRGANGVIIVTTKKGAVGKPVLSYSGTYGFKEVAHLVQMANADEYKSYITDTAPGTTFPNYPGFEGATTNWYKEILKRSTFQNHNLAVSGATDNVRYYFSGYLLQDDGIVTQNKFQCLTVRSNTSFSLSDKVTISSQASFSHVNRREGVFPSLGLGWVISDEDFLKDVKGLSFLKLRTSYGRLGNDQIPVNSCVTTADINIPYIFSGQLVLGAVISQLKDGNVHWETTREYDAAIEFGFLDNFLTGEVAYYNKLTSSALISD